MMVPDHRAGTQLRCPRCGVELRVPGEVPARPPVAAKEPVEHKSRRASQSGIRKGASASNRSLATAHFAPVEEVRVESKEPPVAQEEKVAVLEPAMEALRVADLPRETASAADARGNVGISPRLAPAVRPPAVAKGWIPAPHQQATAFYLAVVLAALAVFGVAPAVWEWFALWQKPEETAIPPWVFALMIVGIVQVGYAIYLAQVPDWSALWTTTIATLGAAAAWATLLGTTLLGKQESMLVVLFRYADKLEGNRAAMWCFVMLCLTSVLAYFLGLSAARWHRSYRVLRELRSE
jgi:hypothetical protein